MRLYYFCFVLILTGKCDLCRTLKNHVMQNNSGTPLTSLDITIRRDHTYMYCKDVNNRKHVNTKNLNPFYNKKEKNRILSISTLVHALHPKSTWCLDQDDSCFWQELSKSDLLLHLVVFLKLLTFETKKDARLFFVHALQRKVGARYPAADYVSKKVVKSRGGLEKKI